MSELDRLGKRHARVVKDALADREPPSLDTTLSPKPAPQRRWLVALVTAAAVGLVALPLIFDFGPAQRANPPADLDIATPTTWDGEPIPTSMPGWEFTVLDHDMRDGAGHAVSDAHLFTWGGVDAGDEALLMTLAQPGLKTTAAPIEPRVLPAVVWDGSEFIVFGGHDASGNEYVDGAAYDPETDVWRSVPPAPLEADRYPAAVWAGSRMFVWVDNQVASYDPGTDSWDLHADPPIVVSDAVLLAVGTDLVLIGGPYMRDIGEDGASERMWVTRLDPATDEWSDPIGGPFADLARPALGPDGEIYVMTSPSMHVVEDDSWRAIGPTHHCDPELAMTAGGNHVFINGVLDWEDPAAPGAGGCTSYIFGGSWDEITRILEWNAFGQPGDGFRSAFLATEDGRLVTLGESDGTTVLGVYQPG